MRLRNIPGAQDAILESAYVVQEPEKHKGNWGDVFEKKQPFILRLVWGKDVFLWIWPGYIRKLIM